MNRTWPQLLACVEESAAARVAEEEGLDRRLLDERIADGTIVILGGHGRARPVGIGRGLRTKVNCNLGTSPDVCCLETELAKLRAAESAGTDTVMDLSLGGDLHEVRCAIRDATELPLGSVPLYEVGVGATDRFGSLESVPPGFFLEAVETHCRDGVDFVTVHCGVTKLSLERLRLEGRTTGVVSRGGSLVAHYIEATGRENPLYEGYDELLAILKQHAVAISIGDGLRPGAGADATDRAQVAETILIGELVDRAREAGVPAFVEGPGHMPLDQIAANVVLQKRLCHGAPFYVLGPLVTDVAPGYDHITGAIGGAICAAAGADFLCDVTPAEHLSLPTERDIIDGVMASRIAGHAADLVKGLPGAAEWDAQMSHARKALDWRGMAALAMDREKVETAREQGALAGHEACTMCGRYCSMKVPLSAGRPSECG
ncbi:MAG: phosphomethylpyrimidine synthase ThiC [Armatimonadetes bacterium]|nr:phosphomethylpyrimidine synthase ThiC [Armatimonadota bacterium]